MPDFQLVLQLYGGCALLALFRDEKFSVDGVDFSDMTCSAGTAEVTGEIEKVKISETTDKLYNELCDRLYRAKASGGDYVVGSPRANRMA